MPRSFAVRVLLLLLLLVTWAWVVAPQDLLAAITDTASLSWDWLAKRTGIVDVCPYVDDVMDALNASLPLHIRGQHGGVEIILNAVASWEFQRRVGLLSEPLVLAIAGSTGVGKSETAYRVAEAVFAKRTRVGSSRRFLPDGLLVLRGEDYSSESEAAMLGMGEVHRRIKGRIVDHLRACSGNAVVVFDEVQKVVPGALDALMPGLRERGAFTVVTPKGSGTSAPLFAPLSTAAAGMMLPSSATTPSPSSTEVRHEEVSTANCIFIFISDIGADRMTNLLLAYGDRASIPQNVLRAEVKTALDEQWARLHFGTAIKEVVPYLPMEQPQIEEVLRLKMASMAAEYRHFYWLDLVIDDAVVRHLSGPRYIKYYNHTAKFRVAGGKDDADGPGGAASGAEGTAADETSEVPPTHKAPAAKKTIVRSKSLAQWGARALENAGPIQDLRSLMFRYMPPWQPRQVLHIGLTDPSTEALQALRWGQRRPVDAAGGHRAADVGADGDASVVAGAEPPPASSSGASGSGSASPPGPQVFLQWCTLLESMVHGDGLRVDAATAFSEACETVWFGDLAR